MKLRYSGQRGFIARYLRWEFSVREEWVRGFDGVEVVDCVPQHEIGMTGCLERGSGD